MRPGERTQAGAVLPGVRRIGIVRDDRLGDVLVTLPAVEALRRTYPEARLSLVVAPGLASIGELVPAIEDVLVAPASVAATVRQFAARSWDLVVCISREPRPALAAALARVPCRVGTGRRWYSPLFHRRVREPRRRGERHEAEYALAFAHRAGAEPGPARFPIEVPPAAVERHAGRLAAAGVGTPYVLIHPGSRGSCPVWPVEHFVSLADSLDRRGVPVVLSVGPSDREVERALEEGPASRLPRFGGGLVELAALVQAASLVVGSSTGPIHLAAALDVPALALHAPWTSCGPSRWGPYSERGLAIVADFRPAMTWSRGERRARSADLMRAILPSFVEEQILLLL